MKVLFSFFLFPFRPFFPYLLFLGSGMLGPALVLVALVLGVAVTAYFCSDRVRAGGKIKNK